MEYKELVDSFASSLGLEGAQTEGGACAFEIDGMKVNIFHDETAGTVMIYGEIGLPSSDDDRTFGTGSFPLRSFASLNDCICAGLSVWGCDCVA